MSHTNPNWTPERQSALRVFAREALTKVELAATMAREFGEPRFTTSVVEEAMRRFNVRLPLRPGESLANGAVVIEANDDLVLAVWNQGSSKFVTWLVDEDRHAYHGHYHRNIDEALAEFRRRVAARQS